MSKKAKGDEALPKAVQDALSDDDPIQKLRTLRDFLTEELDEVDRKEAGYLIPQLTSQLQACIRLIETIKDQLLARADVIKALKAQGGPADGSGSGGSDSGTARDRWADRVGAADAGAAP